MRPLIIHKDTAARIHDAIAAARANPTPWEVLAPFAMKDPGPELTLKDRKRGNNELMEKLVPRSQFVEIPVGYLAAISFEYQPAGLCRHLSISVEGSAKGKIPGVEACQMIAKEFGFTLDPHNSRIWLEEFAPGQSAVNIVQIEKYDA